MKTKMAGHSGLISAPFLNLPGQHRALRQELLAAIERVLENSQFILGPEVAALEKRVAAACGVEFGIGVNSGTDALMLSLKALGVGPGDEVIVPDFTFAGTATAVLLAGAVPVMADIDLATFQLDPAAARAAITPQTKALIPVHLYGHPADMTSLMALAQEFKLAVVEDACQALGAQWQGKPVGGWGDLACFSFFPTKNLGGMGDGGMVVTSSPELAHRLQRLRQHGAEQRYYHVELGYNSRLDEIQAAALNVKWQYLEAWNQRRRSLAALYDRALVGSSIQPPLSPAEAVPVYHQYAVRARHRDQLQVHFHRQGVGTAIHYPLPLHQQPILANLPSARTTFPASEQAAREVLCLPIAPEITDRQAEAVAAALQNFSGE